MVKLDCQQNDTWGISISMKP